MNILNKLTLALTALLLAAGLHAAGPLEYAPALAVEQASSTEESIAPSTDVPQQQTASSLEEAVQSLIASISAQKGFEDWQQAQWTSYPLGPGTHGWVVLLKTGGRETGYLVIHDTGDGAYRLSEYGRGEYPLFSLQTLHHSLVQLDLIPSDIQAQRLYYNPLEAFWIIAAPGGSPLRYLDAKTGEELPLKPGDLPKLELRVSDGQLLHTGSPAPRPQEPVHGISSFDPYERLPWVQSASAAPPSSDVLGAWLEQGRKPIFAANVYSGRHLIPLPVTGLQTWSGGTAYVRVQEDDERYLPLESMQRLGGFYP
ncbi:hypothetical protein [Paenibacillus sp. KR2-11]|uniref:hypothetical protein n=1 Tax=Paenibacillus sp. KR2-11 TaxID=3385500 RepID=UPI0038FD3301